MIIRGNRSASRHQIDEQRLLQLRVQDLRRENRELRLGMLRVEQKLLQAQQGKKKYKMKYKQARQKIEILGLATIYPNKYKDSYDCCISPRTQTHTRIKTTNQSEIVSLRAGLLPSEIEDYIPTKHYLPQADDYQCMPKKNLTPVTSFKQSQANRDETKMLQSLMSIHEQLEKLSAQIEQKHEPSQKIVQLQRGLYTKMEDVVDRLSKMEVRENERQNQRVVRQKEREAKRHSSCLKTVQNIGKDLLQFKYLLETYLDYLSQRTSILIDCSECCEQLNGRWQQFWHNLRNVNSVNIDSIVPNRQQLLFLAERLDIQLY